MADVTISSLPTGTPSGNNILPYSTGSNTLGAPVSALYQGSSSFYLTNSTNPTIWASSDISLTSQSIYIQANTTSSENRLGSYTNHPLTLVTNNTERMRINTNGDVSIPGKLTNSGAAKAWVLFNGGSVINGAGDVSVYSSFNVTRVNRTQQGVYSIYLTTPLADTNYVVSGSVPNTGQFISGGVYSSATRSNSIIYVSTGMSSSNLTDVNYTSVIIFGN